MASNNDSIRVTLRYRPVNKVESVDPDNKIVTKVSECSRATVVTAPDRPQYPYSYSFDRIYQSGVTQREVYQFTGRPLIDAMKEGYNSTLFAYGQTGSGKTFSMMGIAGNEDLKGIQPRVIEDVFDYIENEAVEDGCDYTVSISMMEIYRERIRDLLNKDERQSLKIRDSKMEGIYVEGAQEKQCFSAMEVLQAMDNGFEQRVTKMTGQNPMSSRSHCVTILKVLKVNPETKTKQVMKIKMVDLAGSEKTKKTGATGDLLLEAKAINASLTALSKCLFALSEGRTPPFRDSKLTRLLQDALGGNSKTSLLLAASPCSFNVEETLSTLRFGKAAKLVKNVVVKNIERSPAEMKRQIKKLTMENGVLTEQVNDLKEQASAAEEKFGGEWRELVQKLINEKNKGLDLASMTFKDNSEQVYMLDHKGNHLEGEKFEADTGNFLKKSAQEKRALQMLEWDKMADIVGALIRKGDFDGVSDELQGHVNCGSVSKEHIQEYQDQLDDLRAELREMDNLNYSLEDQVSDLENVEDQLRRELGLARAKYAEMRTYEQKVKFLEKEVELTMKNFQNSKFVPQVEEGETGIDLSILEGAPNTAWANNMKALVEKMNRKMGKQMATIKSMQGDAGLGVEDILERLDNGDQRGAVKMILDKQKKTERELLEQRQKTQNFRSRASVIAKQFKTMKQLNENKDARVHQMEQAVILTNQIHKDALSKHAAEMKKMQEQLANANTYIRKLKSQKGRPAAGGRITNRIKKKLPLKGRPKKVRQSRSNSPEQKMEAGQSVRSVEGIQA